VLEAASQLQDMHVPPWSEDDTDIAGGFGLSSTQSAFQGVFKDPYGWPNLSQRQRDSLYTWQRLADLVKASTGDKAVIFDSPPHPGRIRQGLVGDCSFLSALSVLAEYERRFEDPVLSSIIFPKGESKYPIARAGPTLNPHGKYGCRLFLNGTFRKVVVDDFVPLRKEGRLLCAHSGNAREMWVTLLEKSFVKIMGGSYDMQGSNPGTDIFHLAGWVPETLPLKVEGEMGPGHAMYASPAISTCGGGRRGGWPEVFEEACDALAKGTCVLCVGTSELPDAVPDSEAKKLGHLEGVSASTGLVSRHAYPVLDARRLGSHKLLRLKNPWGKVRWRGRFSPGDAAWQEALAEIATGTSTSSTSPADVFREALGSDPEADVKTDDGHFWIDWQDVLQHFSHVYICWNPRALRLESATVHARWDPPPLFLECSLPDDTHIMAWNPQFSLKLQHPLPPGEGVAFWALLSRHVRKRSDVVTRYVATHVYQCSDQGRLCCPDAPLEQGIYSNGECALVKLTVDKANGCQEFTLAVSQHAQKSAFSFTLQVYSPVPITLTPIPDLVPEGWHSGRIDGYWQKASAGGCSNNLWSFFKNPHWSIEVPPGGLSHLYVFLECSAEHSLNIRLFSGLGARPEQLRFAKSSGPYRQGCCFLKLTDLSPGPYVAVVSTFRSGLVGSYRLSYHAPQKVDFRPHPQPFAYPLELPITTTARKVSFGKSTTFKVSAGGKATVLMSARAEGSLKGNARPTLRVWEQQPDSPAAVEAALELKENYAQSYFESSGCAVLLAVPIRPNVEYLLEVEIPSASDEVSEGDIFFTSDGELKIEVVRYPNGNSPQSGKIERQL